MSAQQEKLDLLLFGSAFAQVFGTTTLTPKDEKITVQVDSRLGGVLLVATQSGLEFPTSSVTSTKSNILSRSPCVLFVAENLETDFEKFLGLMKSYNGYVILIVSDEACDQKKWASAVKDQGKLFRCFGPTSPKEAQEFVGNAVTSVLMWERLLSAEIA